MIPASAPPPRALLDANTLFGALTRDVLLTLAAEDIFDPFWSQQIQDEWTRNLIGKYSLPAAQVSRTTEKMNAAFPNAMVAGAPGLEARFPGVHPGDLHVAASALAARATHLVTSNAKHFRDPELGSAGIEVISADRFVERLIQEDAATVLHFLDRMRSRMTRPPYDRPTFRALFHRAGLPRSSRLLPKS